MEFDESKVYTLVNADKVKIGSKGYFSDSFSQLKEVVSNNSLSYYGGLTDIHNDRMPNRFEMNTTSSWILFYLVEEPEEKRFRAYVDTDEMIDHFCSHFNLNPQSYILPTLWVKFKGDNNRKYLITRIREDTVTICLEHNINTFSLKHLFEGYTWLDDSPCGVEGD